MIELTSDKTLNEKVRLRILNLLKNKTKNLIFLIYKDRKSKSNPIKMKNWTRGMSTKRVFLYEYLRPDIFKSKIKNEKVENIKSSLVFLKNKAKTLEDIFNNSQYILNDEINFNKEDLKLVDNKAKKIISEFNKKIKEISRFTREDLKPIIQDLIKSNNTNFKGVGQPLRIALTGSKFGPGIYDIIVSLGKEEVEKRLSNKIIL